jgi:hypothetical protein
VRRGTEAIDPDALGVPCQPQRAVTDQPRAEERCRLEVLESLGDREAEALVCHRALGVATVAVVAGEARAVAEVLAARAAVAALAVGPAEPGHAHPRPGREALAATKDPRHDLVTGHERELRLTQLAVDDVQVRAAHPAREDLQRKLARAGLRVGQLRRAQRRAWLIEHHRAHARSLRPGVRCVA